MPTQRKKALRQVAYIATRIDRATIAASAGKPQHTIAKLIDFAYRDANRGRYDLAMADLEKLERAIKSYAAKK